MSELKPCPFCGGTKICTEKGINLNYCDSCSAEANIEHWNTRPIEDELRARIAELETENAELKPYRDGYDACENFPEEGVNVIAARGNWFFLAQRRGDKWYDYWWNHGANITHYMPLPTPPEVQE